MQKLTKSGASVKAAYQSIHYFFDLYFLRNAIQHLEGLIEGAAGTAICKIDTPANLLFYTKQLETLCNAAFTICNTKGSKNIACIPVPEKVGTPRVDQYSNYMRPNTKLMPWDCFPWHLSPDEYYTPYIAIKKFVATMPKVSWYKILYEVLEYAFSNGSISETCPVYKLLLVRKRLLALVEAFYLIEVRCLSKENSPIKHS